MSEENNVDVSSQEPQGPSEVEQRAMEMGWRPKEEFDGEDDNFVDAKEFVRRKPLFDKISQQSRANKQLRQEFEALKTHYTTVRETEYKRAVEALKAERKAALSDGDGDRFEALSDEIKTLETQAASMAQLREQQPVVEEQVHPQLQAWISQNQWYTSNKYMHAFADDVGQKLHAQGLSPEEVLREVTKAVKKEFPNKFTNVNKEQAPNVTDASGKPSKSGNSSLSAIEATLNPQERKIMQTLVNSGAVTKEQYLKDLLEVEKRK